MTSMYHAPEAARNAGPEVQTMRRASSTALLAAASEVEKLADPDEDDLALEFGEDLLSGITPDHAAGAPDKDDPQAPDPGIQDDPADATASAGEQPPASRPPDSPPARGGQTPAPPAPAPVREAEIDDPHAPDRGMRIDDVPQETIDEHWGQRAEDDIREDPAAITDQIGDADADEPGGLSLRLSEAPEAPEDAGDGFGEHDGLRRAPPDSETEDALRSEFRPGEPARTDLDPLAREAASAMTEIAAQPDAPARPPEPHDA